MQTRTAGYAAEAYDRVRFATAAVRYPGPEDYPPGADNEPEPIDT